MRNKDLPPKQVWMDIKKGLSLATIICVDPNLKSHADTADADVILKCNWSDGLTQCSL